MSNGEKPRRKIVQIAYAAYQGNGIVALCDDGSMWILDRPWDGASKWQRVKDVPIAEGEQDEDRS